MTNLSNTKSTYYGNLYVLLLIVSFYAVPMIIPMGLFPANYQVIGYLLLSHFCAIIIYFALKARALPTTSPTTLPTSWLTELPTLFSIKEEFNLSPVSLKTCLMSFVTGILVQPFLMIISGISSIIFPNNMSSALMDYSSMPFHLTLITIAIIPGIMEEIGFRGIVLTNYKNMTTKKAAIITGFLFAVVHMDLQQFLYTFVIGIFFAYVAKTVGSIIPTIIAHITINATQVYLSYCQFAKGTLPGPIEDFGVVLWNYFVSFSGVLISIAFIVFMVIFNKRNLAEVKEEKRKIFNFQEEVRDEMMINDGVADGDSGADKGAANDSSGSDCGDFGECGGCGGCNGAADCVDFGDCVVRDYKVAQIDKVGIYGDVANNGVINPPFIAIIVIYIVAITAKLFF